MITRRADYRQCIADRDQPDAGQPGGRDAEVKTPLLTKATGYEGGARSEPFPNRKLDGALFVLNLNGEATLDGAEVVTVRGRPSQRKGIELAASYKPLPWLRLDGDFAATHARYANGDNGAADTEPDHPLFRPAPPDRGRQRDLPAYDTGRFARRLQIIRAGDALARHSQPSPTSAPTRSTISTPAIGERDRARLRRPFQAGRAAVGAVHSEHDVLTNVAAHEFSRVGGDVYRDRTVG